ncbi:hypothetical protein F5884DRAFT_768782 [Xylogone sp. PMI_703]|nr:hypothetical protein F5884DRAFT_768782 [Xylogone sp. PMI_703]
MGKRKKSSRKPQGPKKNEPLTTVFPCLFCNHEKSVTVKLDKKAGVGNLSCKVCGQKFQCAVNYLSAAVDVYADWVDACDAVAKEANGNGDLLPGSRMSGAGARRDRDDDDDDIIDDEDDERPGAGYEGDGIVADDDEY